MEVARLRAEVAQVREENERLRVDLSWMTHLHLEAVLDAVLTGHELEREPRALSEPVLRQVLARLDADSRSLALLRQLGEAPSR